MSLSPQRCSSGSSAGIPSLFRAALSPRPAEDLGNGGGSINTIPFLPLLPSSFDLLAVQGSLKSLFQHHSLKALILWYSVFFMVQLSQPHVTTGRTVALTIRTFVNRVMCLLYNTLTRFVITFLPGSGSNHLLISWLQSPSAVIFQLKKRNSHCFHPFPFYLP